MDKLDIHIHNTIPKLFWYNVEHHSDDISNWQKEKGIWKSTTWREYGTFVNHISNALLDAKIEKGDKVSIISLTRFEWVVCDLAIMSIGAVTVPVYPSNTKEQVRYILDHSQSKFVFAEDQEQLEKIWENLDILRKVVVFDKYQSIENKKVMLFDTFRGNGKHYGSNHKDQLNQLIKDGKPENIISLIYTSGTTGRND